MSYISWENNAPEKVNFQKEISSMMHGFGDNPNPNAATVLLVENIVLQQLRSMLQEAYHNSQLRGSKVIHNIDVIFLMRKNKLKLKRLHDYQLKLTTSETVLPALGSLGEDEKDPNLKHKRTHIEVIKELDESDEVMNIKYDIVDHKRKVRAAQISELMPLEKYSAYQKARCASFRSGFLSGWAKNYSKLEMWINPNKEFKIAYQAMEVLSFLACETVGEIIDGVFLIRQDAKKKHGDPFSKLEGGNFCNPLSLGNAVYIKSGYEGVPVISVAEVREVLRRHYPPCVGMNGLFTRNMSMDVPVKFIAL